MYSFICQKFRMWSCIIPLFLKPVQNCNGEASLRQTSFEYLYISLCHF